MEDAAARKKIAVEKEPLYPPVVPSWGGMLPAVPPAGYGDIAFEPSSPIDGQDDAADIESRLDRDALSLRRKVFPSSPR